MISLNLLPAPVNKLIGHRGAPKKAPENTLASFQCAFEEGLSWIEFDVQLTKDGQLVIFHDETLERTSNGQGLLKDHTLAELKQLDVGSWFAPEFKNERMPTLIEAILHLKRWNILPIIEIKCREYQNPVLTQKTAYAVADCLTRYWRHTPLLPMVSSFDHHALLHYRARLKKPALVGFLVDNITPEHLALVSDTPHSLIHCNQRDVSPEEIKALADEHIPLFVYTVNDRIRGQAYLEAGALAIFTDQSSLYL